MIDRDGLARLRAAEERPKDVAERLTGPALGHAIDVLAGAVAVLLA